MIEDQLTVSENGQGLTFHLNDLMNFHGYAFRGGVTHGFKIMKLAFPLLSPGQPPERHLVHVRTAFQGAGARDAFELVTRCYSEGRYIVDDALMQADRGPTLMRYVFEVSYRGRSLNMRLREGIVEDEFVALARKADRSTEDDARMKKLQSELAARLRALAPEAAYEIF
ncbi:hypothetical protein [Sinorhizobium medicae]|uniref:hypothetical protein n=1 Tax=Sinorhizobium medicae TaxID=110321 RepID=UPI000FDA85CD|nr:hypothetical protein [Sinorhizobium medicae]RVO73550.1 hypothetical protein CN084_24995 [Sinorhizobium medicae]